MTPARAARRPSPPCRAALAATALAAVAGLAGCSATNPVTTNQPYVPGNGTAIDMGAINAQALVVVAQSKDSPGVVSGRLVNDETRPQRVEFSLGSGAPAVVEVPARSSTTLSAGTSRVVVPGVPQQPGGIVQLNITSQADGRNVVEVPVLAPIGIYADLQPPPG